MAQFAQGNMEAAQAYFEAHLVREPQSGPGLLRLSMVHLRRRRTLLALDFARRALLVSPDRVELLAHLARCHLLAGQPEAARGLATRAMAMPRNNPAVLHTLGGVMTQLDEQAIAMELLDQAISLDPTSASMYFNRGQAQQRFGHADAAESDFESCLALQASHAKAHWALAGLRVQKSDANHIGRLQQALASAPKFSIDAETVALALFKELDDVHQSDLAWPNLASVIAGRATRRQAPGIDLEAGVSAIIAACDERFIRGRRPATSNASPLFVFGMPRSGVALLGSLLSRHSRIHHLGSQAAFSQLLGARLGMDALGAFDPAIGEACRTVDLDALGTDYLQEVSPSAATPLIVCESEPMNFQLAGLIGRALPRARMLNMVRDPVDTCLSLLAHPAEGTILPVDDPSALASTYLQYGRLLQHWHALMPERIMDVEYQSLVEKPEMILRVICSFLGIRYGSSLRLGLQLHQRSIGRGHRYLDRLPSLARALSSPASKNKLSSPFNFSANPDPAGD